MIKISAGGVDVALIYEQVDEVVQLVLTKESPEMVLIKKETRQRC